MAEILIPNPVKQTLSVVFVGSFNPRIFHPTWFEREGLSFPEEEAASLSETKTDGPLVTPDLSRCEIGPEISIECLTSRLSINAATTLGEERDSRETSPHADHGCRHQPFPSFRHPERRRMASAR